ncbi:hypothetical protein Tco_1046166 [Tanacetum coccineum]
MVTSMPTVQTHARLHANSVSHSPPRIKDLVVIIGVMACRASDYVEGMIEKLVYGVSGWVLGQRFDGSRLWLAVEDEGGWSSATVVVVWSIVRRGDSVVRRRTGGGQWRLRLWVDVEDDDNSC